MSSAKGIAIAVVVIVVIGIIAGGGAFLAATSKQKRAAENLKTAKDLLENKKTEAAVRLLKESLTKYPNMPTAPETMFLLAQILHDQEQNSKEAMALFESLLEKYPDSAYARQAIYYKAVSLLDEKSQSEETRAFFKDLYENATNKQSKYVAQYGLALADLEDGKFKEAGAKMASLLDRSLPDKLRSKIEFTLGDLNIRLLYSPETGPNDKYYKIKKRDYIYKLARQFDVPQELIMKCNNITDPKRLSIGQRIKIPGVSFSIVVDKYDNTLTLLSNGKFFKKYKVRTGAYENQTPTGEYKIQNKKKNPRWVNPRTHKMYPPGDPENELGTRWMSFQNDMLGIHGTIKPETVGYYSSFGCVGMYREDVEELFDLIPVGTPVKIVGKMNPEVVEESRALGFRE